MSKISSGGGSPGGKPGTCSGPSSGTARLLVEKAHASLRLTLSLRDRGDPFSSELAALHATLLEADRLIDEFAGLKTEPWIGGTRARLARMRTDAAALTVEE